MNQVCLRRPRAMSWWPPSTISIGRSLSSAQYRDQLAAVIVEPVMGSGGMISAEEVFLRGLREATREHGVLLIVDEIITFRLAPGAAQQLYGVDPDLTTLGKVIGGGLPVGAFGGRAAVMERFDPRRQDRIAHSGTFNGNAVTLAAGRAALELLTPVEIARINALGDELRSGFQGALEKADIPGQATGLGSLVQIHVTDVPVRDYRGAARGRGRPLDLIRLALLNRGIFCVPHGSFNISTPMSKDEVQRAVETFRGVVEEVAPILVEHANRRFA